jgi:Flp pilus assembly protein TadD
MAKRQTKRIQTVTGGTSAHVTLTKSWWVFAVLVAINLISYAPSWHYGFVNYDDPAYVSSNPAVTGGLTWNAVKWAFTTGHESNWHPLTWLSHMADVELFGLNAGAFHVINFALHVASTLLLFWFLNQTTGNLAASALVGALFAVHPLHVESVAWIAERKDVLSTFLGMCTLCAYVMYVRRAKLELYLVVFGLLALGLMAKPMLVTMPFLLLLLDFWPLGRLRFETKSNNLAQLIREKVPLMMLVAVSSIVTYLVQKQGGSMGQNPIPLATRIANACTAYFVYAWRMVWPAKLAVLYPVASAPAGWWAGAALGLFVLSLLAVWAHGTHPYITVGWFWYVGTLVPVIGLVQVGRQASADRYTYLPLIGLFLIAAFGIQELFGSSQAGKLGYLTAAAMTIAACIYGTRVQLEYWSDSRLLWQHTLEVTTDNSLAHNNLGTAFEATGELDMAIFHYSEAVRIEPQYAEAHYNLAKTLLNSGKMERAAEAETHLLEALNIKPNLAEAHSALGTHLLTQGKIDEAISHLSQATRLKPGYAVAHNSLASAFASQGRIDEALSECLEAVRLDPGYIQARNNAGILLSKQGKTSEAIAQFSEVLRISSNNQVAQTWLKNLKGSHDSKQ